MSGGYVRAFREVQSMANGIVDGACPALSGIDRPTGKVFVKTGSNGYLMP